MRKKILNTKTLTVFIISLVAFVFVAATQAVSYRIFTIGDSTVQDYTTGYAPRKGWGQMLPFFFSSTDVQVLNRAVGGTSSKSFYNSFWSGVKSELKSGDFILIQFGINDRAADTARAAKGEVFKGYIRKYVNEARAKGAIPILVATLRRNAWNADGVTTYDSYHEHPQLMREVAAELNVPLIDLDKKAKAGMEKVGSNYCTWFWYNNYVAGEYPNYPNGNTDNVHFQEMGALQMAKHVVEGLTELSSNSSISKLLPFLQPQHKLSIKVNYPDAGTVTLTETYPAGVNIHMKALANPGHTFLNWQSTANTIFSTNKLVQFKMPASSLYFIAFFDDQKVPDCAGVYGGTATLDNCNVCSGGTTGKTACTPDCNGDWGGKAYLDNCSQCIGGKTGRTLACVGSMEGEDACTNDGITESLNAGFVGAGYANTNNILGASLSYHIVSDQNQTVELSFRFANGGAPNRDGIIKVDGNAVGTLLLPTTGNWTTWYTSTTSLTLSAGKHNITIEANSANGLANIDLISWTKTGISAGSCIITALENEHTDISFAPNPFAQTSTILAKGAFSYTVINELGIKIETGQAVDRLEIGESYNRGFYTIILQTKTNTQTFKLLKK